MAGKLTAVDCNKLKANCDVIGLEVDVQGIIHRLYNNGRLPKDDAIRLCEGDVPNKKRVHYLIYDLLLKSGTYSDLEQIHQALCQSRQEGARKYFPSFEQQENDEVDQDEYSDESAEGDGEGEGEGTRVVVTEDGQEVEEMLDAKGVRTVTKMVMKEVKNQAKKVICKKSSAGQDAVDGAKLQAKSCDDPAEQADEEDGSEEEVSRTAGVVVTDDGQEVELMLDAGSIMTVTKKVIKGVKRQTKNILVKKSPSKDEVDGVKVKNNNSANTRDSLDKFKDAFLKYATKPNHGPYGKGLCVVFALFTGDLPGYYKDITNIYDFFERVMGYQVKMYENLTQAELLDRVKVVQELIQDGGFDRLFVIILSHGGPKGIYTCANKAGMDMETKPNSEDRVETSICQIVDEFKHDKLPSLKGMPKVFLVQACRGPPHAMVAAAGDGDKITDDKEDTLPYKPMCPVDADIMICYATTLDHPSLVSEERGSWFIEDMLEVFRRHHKTHHLADMMTVVHLAIAERRGRLVLSKHQKIAALQMPCTWTSFRKIFYLYY